jgi:hypothetical protein
LTSYLLSKLIIEQNVAEIEQLPEDDFSQLAFHRIPEDRPVENKGVKLSILAARINA